MLVTLKSSPYFRSLLGDNILVLGTILALTLAFIAAGKIYSVPINFDIYFGWQLSIGPLTIVLTFWMLCIGSLALNRPEEPTKFIVNRIFRVWRMPHHLMRGLPVFLTMALPLSAFTSYKLSIPAVVPFYADTVFADLDVLIHGTDPWRLLQPIFGYPIISSAINTLYLVWFPYMFFTLSIAIFILPDVQLRARYLTSFFLSWGIVGGIVATVFSSVGPCFYLEFYSVDRFAELMNYLREANDTQKIAALSGQAMLLEKYRLNESGIGVGISAFPSMHVAIVVLNAIFLQKINRYAGYLAWAFALVIFIGSVHLAWHYAVDGYASALLVLGIWWVMGKLSKMVHPSDAEQVRQVDGAALPDSTVPQSR